MTQRSQRHQGHLGWVGPRRFAAERPSPGPVASTSVGWVDAQPIRSLPIACALDGAGQAERLDQWRRLLARADRRERVEGGLRFQLPATLAGPAAELAAAEQRCCAFFAFTLRLAGGGLELEVRAPTEALPLLTEVFGPARLFWRPLPRLCRCHTHRPTRRSPRPG